jgi:hypothetical protein
VYLTAVYWYRFALPALFLASPLAARFLRQGLTRLTAHLSPRYARKLAVGLAAIFLTCWYPSTGLDIMGMIFTTQTNPTTRLVDYLRAHVPEHCLIETPEYELVFLDDQHQIHVMPAFFFVESTPHCIKLLNPRWQPYDFNTVGADYLILGSFGKSVFREVYAPERVDKNWRKIAQVDFYDIYVTRHRPARVWKKVTTLSQPHLKSPLQKNDLPAHVSRTPDNPYHH